LRIVERTRWPCAEDCDESLELRYAGLDRAGEQYGATPVRDDDGRKSLDVDRFHSVAVFFDVDPMKSAAFDCEFLECGLDLAAGAAPRRA
jgi:hypothetical protein